MEIKKENLVTAAALVDATYGQRQKFKKALLEHGRKVSKCYKFFHNTLPFNYIVLALLTLLAFFERPSWCFSSDCSVPRDPQNVVPGKQAVLYFSGFPFLPTHISLALELAALIIISIFSLGASLLIRGLKKSLLTFRGTSVLFAVLLVSLVDVIVSLCVNRSWRLSTFLRPFLLLLVPNGVYREVKDILRILPRVAETFAFLAALVLISAWIGLVLWYPSDYAPYFSSPQQALSTTQTMITTVNYPDAMVPYYARSWAAFIYFMLFFAVGYYFFLPLVLSVTFAQFKLRVESEDKRCALHRRKALQMAFAELDWKVFFLFFKICFFSKFVARNVVIFVS